MSKTRTFDFPAATTRGDGLRTIQAALEDEGLVLTAGSNARFDGVNTFLVQGVKRFVVPTHRIAVRGF